MPAARVDATYLVAGGCVYRLAWCCGKFGRWVGQPYPNLSLQEIFAGVMTGTLRPSIPADCDPDWMALMQGQVQAVGCIRSAAGCWNFFLARSRRSWLAIVALDLMAAVLHGPSLSRQLPEGRASVQWGVWV